MVPSQLYAADMEAVSKEQGNHLYLLAVGPRVNALSVDKKRDGWRICTEYFDGRWRPRTLHIPAGLLRADNLDISDGVIVQRSGTAWRRRTPVEVARLILENARSDGSLSARSWEIQTIRKYFRYSVVYVGQAYGRDTRRSAIKRLTDGHDHLQAILARVNDHYRNSDVGVILMDASVPTWEMSGTVTAENAEELSKLSLAMMGSSPRGPFHSEALLIDAAEAMLIRYLQPVENKKLKEFPLKDRPGLVESLVRDGITHLGVQIDLSQSFAVLQDPVTNEVKQHHRYAVNLRTGDREVASNSLLSWQI